MNKDITFHINNLAYTINVDEELEKELCKYLDLSKNNDTKELLIAYLNLSQEFRVFRKNVEEITEKLSGF
ncbi:hypothetical protein AFAEC_0874 [Aliarcobacter faecis]|uniref:hypothetical protein n=1 Tax=Aliarcobacter faecis TaxID=1564138 RepID=UPI00047D86B3|nr:hypothetical protein [Aliarcobacter faecis]QKF73049.1 hypothetical protein AFAEC_0874 [Aliarcobacter faecis]